MENIHCIICSGKNSSHFITLNDRLTKSSQKFTLVRCDCGFVYLNPRPSVKDIGQYYQSEHYDPHNNSSNRIWNAIYHFVQQLSFRWKYRIIRSYIQRGRLLDIGGGKGDFVEFMHNKGWDVTLQDSMVDLCRKKNSIPFVSDLKGLDPLVKLDVITLWHSLEHIHDIKNLFNYLSRFLTDSGILMIAVPNLFAPERNFYNHNWAPYDAPRHLYHFSFDRLKDLCEQNGYEIIQKYSLYQDLPYNVILSAANYYPLQFIKAIFVICYSLLYNICAGPKYSSSLLIVCRKNI